MIKMKGSRSTKLLSSFQCLHKLYCSRWVTKLTLCTSLSKEGWWFRTGSSGTRTSVGFWRLWKTVRSLVRWILLRVVSMSLRTIQAKRRDRSLPRRLSCPICLESLSRRRTQSSGERVKMVQPLKVYRCLTKWRQLKMWSRKSHIHRSASCMVANSQCLR